MDLLEALMKISGKLGTSRVIHSFRNKERNILADDRVLVIYAGERNRIVREDEKESSL